MKNRPIIDRRFTGIDRFVQRGGLGKAHQLFGDRLNSLLDELNGTLVA